MCGNRITNESKSYRTASSCNRPNAPAPLGLISKSHCLVSTSEITKACNVLFRFSSDKAVLGEWEQWVVVTYRQADVLLSVRFEVHAREYDQLLIVKIYLHVSCIKEGSWVVLTGELVMYDVELPFRTNALVAGELGVPVVATPEEVDTAVIPSDTASWEWSLSFGELSISLCGRMHVMHNFSGIFVVESRHVPFIAIASVNLVHWTCLLCGAHISNHIPNMNPTVKVRAVHESSHILKIVVVDQFTLLVVVNRAVNATDPEPDGR